MRSSKGDSAAVARVRARRSLAQIPHRGNSASVDKENITADLVAIQDRNSGSRKDPGRDKRHRSKSLGPGGLNALKDGSGNRRKSTVAAPLKSILKPTVPVSPISHIPSFEETRKTPNHRPQRKSIGISRNKPSDNDLLIDFSTPTSAPVVGTDNLANPFDGFNPSSVLQSGSLRTEETQHAVVSEKEQQEQRERDKKAILDQRAARRKSMANRRVSFAPEATLHTWNVVELLEDSTSSSANSTRRASSLANGNTGQTSTPPEELSNSEPGSQHFQQQDLHQQKPHHRPDASLAELDNPDDEEMFSSSPFSGGSTAENEDSGAANSNLEEESLSSEPDNESTAMSMDDATERSISMHSGSTTDSNSRLDRSLRLAAQTAGTRGIDYDEDGDLSSEFGNQEIAGAFQPWIKKGAANVDFDAENLSSRLDQENINPVEKSSHTRSRVDSDMGDDSDVSMDITKPVGGILPDSGRKPLTKPLGVNDQHHRPTSTLRRTSSEENTSKQFDEESEVDDDEDMTMEFTSVFGGLITKTKPDDNNNVPYPKIPDYPKEYEREELNSNLDEDDMDMTGAIGGILPPIDERTEPSDDETFGMEMTNALGKILPPFQVASSGRQGRVFDLDADPDQPASSPFQENVSPSPAKPPLPQHASLVASENGSPISAKTRRSLNSRVSLSPDKRYSRPTTPVKSPSTPLKPLSFRKNGPSTPTTPQASPSRSKTRSVSPSKRRKQELHQSQNKSTPVSLFQQDHQTGQSTPTFVLRARTSLSGYGVDKEGLGSPRVAEILDRRRSIGDDAQDFVPKPLASRGVRFEPPQKLEPESDRDTEEGNRDEYHTEESTNQEKEKDLTINLREMISSLTPKKKKLKGRKSLHVGAAKGLLGKRPVELDMDEEHEDPSPKRFRGRDASPVKNIRLPAPPSKAETVGRAIHSYTPSAEVISPSKQISTTPKQPYPYKNVMDMIPRTPTSPQPPIEPEPRQESPVHADADPGISPIQLSEFLDMTKIHFMELTTTKRRHTIAPNSGKKRGAENPRYSTAKEISFQDCVAAGFCTVPMLELYQHSCRELKSYISEGRRIIRSIEEETYAENPPLFQEYITASPDIRLLMDNQFRNVKTHARLLSKSMWYEWRMKLLEGLKQGLDGHVDEMKQDDLILSRKEQLLDDVVPGLVHKHAMLEAESSNLQQVVEEIKSCDQEELRTARDKLSALESELNEKKSRLGELQVDLTDKDNILETGSARKAELVQQIRDAELTREECRGWDMQEVRSLHASVQALEQQTGWAVLSATRDRNTKHGGSTLSLRYAGELQLDFYPEAFNIKEGKRSPQASKDLPLTVSYSPDRGGRSVQTVKPAPEMTLILHAIRARISHLTQSSISPKQFLSGIAKAWDVAKSLQREVRLLGYCGITNTKTVEVASSDPTLLKVRCMLLGWIKSSNSNKGSVAQTPQRKDEQVKKTRARVDIDFNVKPRNGGSKGNESLNNEIDVDIDIDVSASKVYGFENGAGRQMSETQTSDLLAQLIDQNDKSHNHIGNGLWRDAAKALEKKLFC